MCKKLLKKAIKIAGSQAALARVCGVKQAHVWGWLNRSKGRVPPEHCITIEEFTAGAITRYMLRPEIFGDGPENDQNTKLLEQVIKIVGGQDELAKICGVPSSFISNWLTRDNGQVPAEYCRIIEAATGGLISRYELRPLVFGPNPESARRESKIRGAKQA